MSPRMSRVNPLSHYNMTQRNETVTAPLWLSFQKAIPPQVFPETPAYRGKTLDEPKSGAIL